MLFRSAYTPAVPEAVGHDNILSNGAETTGYNTTPSPDVPYGGIDFVRNFGSNLLVGWTQIVSNVLKYGVDYVNDLSPPAATGLFTSLWFDGGSPDKEKTALTLSITFFDLPAGSSITPVYAFDRSATLITGTAQTTTGSKKARLTFPTSASRFYEVMVGFQITSNAIDFPEIVSVNFKYDDNAEEEYDT